MKYERIIQFRVTTDEGEAWDRDAERRQMTLSQWIRSACATFLVAGKNTVIVPAAPEPVYVGKLRRADRNHEPVRGTLGVQERMSEGATYSEARMREQDEVAAAGEQVSITCLWLKSEGRHETAEEALSRGSKFKPVITVVEAPEE